MGRDNVGSPERENPTGYGGGGITYESCDNADVPLLAEYTIGREHYRDFIRWWND